MDITNQEQFCSVCGKTPANQCNENKIEEFEVLDFRDKTVKFLGFPYGETHTVKGWKINYIGSFVQSFICNSCSEKYYSKERKKLKVLGIISVIIILICSPFVIPVFTQNKTSAINIISCIVCFFSLVAFLVVLLDEFPKKIDFYTNRMHLNSQKKMIGFLPKICKRVDEFPSSSKFYLSTNTSPKFSKEFTSNQEKTGWSIFLYVREYGSTSQTLSQEIGASNLKVEHLGVFLEK